ncbi:hypothetical protein [Hyphomonas sp. BRH_c22]|uniref:hypothetical protein n=1 Tax=Hyphomonas sp. BRH_c22 TaxID=1629710 RepID=UPI000A8E4600|nr:hypothetical protein [Hyphomonas sp. BRH_c22]
MAFRWYGETFDLPSRASRLASTPTCENQAFAFCEAVIDFQFDAEATGRDIEHGLVGHATQLEQAELDPVALRRDAARMLMISVRKSKPSCPPGSTV